MTHAGRSVPKRSKSHSIFFGCQILLEDRLFGRDPGKAADGSFQQLSFDEIPDRVKRIQYRIFC
ncbi:hypothetical protein KOR42_30380 [Thalassoglobus neptunius]|uniref:Uncharacterized protein n=1 Tax=Thalassoglobus neptunius TaxID=1938619 RepID=A0A5C5WP19_9PLAN|nr:hypothetical protein KOR42_30380 [Thalassoglobus neptunius]